MLLLTESACFALQTSTSTASLTRSAPRARRASSSSCRRPSTGAWSPASVSAGRATQAAPPTSCPTWTPAAQDACPARSTCPPWPTTCRHASATSPPTWRPPTAASLVKSLHQSSHTKKTSFGLVQAHVWYTYLCYIHLSVRHTPMGNTNQWISLTFTFMRLLLPETFLDQTGAP